ncbi:MAG: molybdenum cofactor carrier protein [Opitutae bacterium]|nr:molybdenum cofactor carrier protein [Opitutae bacterium]MBC9889254.1 molybdenum cofactor carrier protein [Opitutae bacterium]
MGSGDKPHHDLCRPLGKLLAQKPVHLLTGGGRGTMEAVSQSFQGQQPRRGLVVGVLPARGGDASSAPKRGYPNAFVELPVKTHLPLSGRSGQEPLSRNHINILTSDVIVVLPGSAGTRSEAELAARYRKPVILFSRDLNDFAAFPAEFTRTTSLAEVEAFIDGHLNGGLKK